MDVRAAVYVGEGKVGIEDRPMPTLESSTDVILRVTSSAICGTDLHILHGKFPGLEPGLVFGHEFVGEAVDVGDGVRSVQIASRYVASMFCACGACRACMRADFRNCPWFGLFGMGEAFGDLQGGQAEYVRVPLADMTLAEVPESLTDDDVILTTASCRGPTPPSCGLGCGTVTPSPWSE
jgi:threonine dehydrogenase-like Zn-dependent dehydrogenase